jgi:hypothetical protein
MEDLINKQGRSGATAASMMPVVHTRPCPERRGGEWRSIVVADAPARRRLIVRLPQPPLTVSLRNQQYLSSSPLWPIGGTFSK